MTPKFTQRGGGRGSRDELEEESTYGCVRVFDGRRKKPADAPNSPRICRKNGMFSGIVIRLATVQNPA